MNQDSSSASTTPPTQPLAPDDSTHQESAMSRAFYWLRSFYIPTNPTLLLDAQKEMFKKFVRQPVEHKRFVLPSGDYLNYIEMLGSSGIPVASRNHPGTIPDTSQPKKPTLILMHGYGSGLGMFFGM